MAFADLTLATLGRGDIHHLTLTGTSTLRQLHTIAAWVKVGQAVVIPQHAIALTRNQHGDADLGVYLCKSARQSTHIAVAILELSQTKEVFILRRVESQHSLATNQLMVSGFKNSFAGLIFHRQGTTFHLGSNICMFQFIVTHIQPVGQITLCSLMGISHSHSILSHISDRKVLRSGRHCHYTEQNS